MSDDELDEGAQVPGVEDAPDIDLHVNAGDPLPEDPDDEPEADAAPADDHSELGGEG